MEAFLGQKQKQQEFTVSISQLSAPSSGVPCSSALARFSVEPEGAHLRFHQESEARDVIQVDIPTAQPVAVQVIGSSAISHTINFTSVKEEELYEIEIPLSFKASVGSRVHRLAYWFDVLFDGSSVQRCLTAAPGSPTTHWYQLCCVLSQPIYVMAGQEITGRLHMAAHNAQSYTMYPTMSCWVYFSAEVALRAKMWGAGAEQGGILQMSSCKLNLKEPYYRMSQVQAYAWPQDQQLPQLTQSQDAVGPSLVQQLSQNSVASLIQ